KHIWPLVPAAAPVPALSLRARLRCCFSRGTTGKRIDLASRARESKSALGEVATFALASAHFRVALRVRACACGDAEAKRKKNAGNSGDSIEGSSTKRSLSPQLGESESKSRRRRAPCG